MFVVIVFMYVKSVDLSYDTACRAFVLESFLLLVGLFLEQHNTWSDGKHNYNNVLVEI